VVILRDRRKFRRGNEGAEELGQHRIAWGGRTSLQAGGDGQAARSS
jgi:hypothetical protein